MGELEPVAGAALIDQPIMGQVDVEVAREGGLFECFVPLDLVDHMDVPVDHGKLIALEEDIMEKSKKGGTGQKSPARMGYVLGEPNFRIIDGFHRYTALRELGKATIYTTVELMGLDELLDDRIRNANMHDNIRFARTAEWMDESWSLQPLSERIPITSPFTMAHFNFSGIKFGLTEEEARACREWAVNKAHAWGTTVASLYQTLKIARTVAPELVHDVRPAKAVVSPIAQAISTTTVATLSAKLGNQFGHQRVVAKEAAKHGLSGSEVTSLAVEIAGMKVADATAYAAGIDWKTRRKAEKKIFRYDEEEILRTGLIRGSSAIQPLLEMSMVTRDAFLGEDISSLPEGRVEKIAEDVMAVHDHVVGMLAVLGYVADLPDLGELAGAKERSITEFMNELNAGLDKGKLPKITTAKECEAAKELLADEGVMASTDKKKIAQLTRNISAFEDRD